MGELIMHPKSRYDRKKYSDVEIINFVNSVNGFKSLFSEKTFLSKNKWINDVVRRLDVESSNKFFFLLEEKNNAIPICIGCGDKLTIVEYNYRAGAKNKFLKYCKKCQYEYKWISKRDNIKIAKKIQKTKKKWLASDDAKLFYERLGKHNSKHLKRWYQTEEGKQSLKNGGKKISVIIKKMIADGTFTPNITNTFTHWDAAVKVGKMKKRFRSSWEACFWLSNQHLDYETIRIPHITEFGISKTYIGDFFDNKKKLLYEIKPKSFFIKYKHKMDSIIEYCSKNGLKFIWINEFNILDYISKDACSKNINQYQKLLKGIPNEVIKSYKNHEIE
jgi:hypothetical protein